MSLSNLTGIKTTEQITGSIIISMIMKGLYNPSEKKLIKTRQFFFLNDPFFSFAHDGCKLLRRKQPLNLFQKQNFQALTQEKEVIEEGNPCQKKV